MKYWIKRNSGPKGPFSETQIEGFIEAGRLPDGVQVSESQDGPWEPFTIANEDADVTRRKELWDELSNQMDLNAVDEALSVIDELETFDLPAEEKSDLDTLRRSLLESEESHEDYANHDSYEPRTRRRTKKTVQQDDSTSCPFPGILVESILSYLHGDEDREAGQYSTDQLKLFGVGYCVIFSAFTIIVVTHLFRVDARISQVGLAVMALTMSFVVLTFLHFATHFALDIYHTLMLQPAYRISTIRHLQIAICPLLLYFLLALGSGIFIVYTYLISEADPDSMPAGIAAFVSGVGGLFITLKAVLNPKQLGVNVDESATPAETFLGICAIVTRAPMYCARSIYPLSMVLANAGALLFVLNLLFDLGLKLGIAAIVVSGAGGAGIVFPLFAYGLAFYGLFGIELIQAVFDIRRNTQTSR